MLRRTFALLAVVALVAWAAPVYGEEEVKAGTHEGKVVKVEAGKLTMTDKDGKNEHSHAVAKDAKITIDGKDGKLTDLKKGDKITVTMGADKKVTKIEVKRG